MKKMIIMAILTVLTPAWCNYVKSLPVKADAWKIEDKHGNKIVFFQNFDMEDDGITSFGSVSFVENENVYSINDDGTLKHWTVEK